MALVDIEITVRDLGRMSYKEALDEQRRVHRLVVRGESVCTILLVEHDAVITVGRHGDGENHVLADVEELKRAGVVLCDTDRGGDVTYHGPGQLVVYPIIRLNELGLNVRRYVGLLEEVVIEACREFGVEGYRVDGKSGIWVNDGEDGVECKLAAIGVRVERWVTLHGLALNVWPNLGHYDLIVPCGLVNRGVTSLKRLLGERCPTMDEVKDAVCEKLLRGLKGGF